ncbi:MAG: primase, primase protein [Candidatus Parcubacteria bacterium]|jgi:DNA primase
MSSATELIKEKLNIADVIGSYIKVEKSGANYKARCPFHNEKTPSFFISPGRGNYYCFGCGVKGDIFTFVQEFEKVDFIGALKLLAERAGVPLEQFKSENKGQFDHLRTVLEKATNFFQANLKQNKEALAYLKGRGLTDETIDSWRIGYALPEWRTLHDDLLRQGVSVSDMEAVGLVKRSDPSNDKQTVYDRFRSRIIFPLFDTTGRVIGYSGRIFGEEATKKNDQGESVAPKYLNSPDTPLFNKSEILYGFNKAKEGMRQWGYAVLVEGQMDLLMCHQSGFNNAVATSGTSLTDQHLDKIKKMSNNLMIVYDADKAGLKATLRAWTAALSLGMDVKIAGLPVGEDPASILLSNKEQFKEALKHSKHIIDYYLDILLREKLPERKLWQAVETEVLPYAAAIESAIDKSHFITRISLRTGIPEDALREQLKKHATDATPQRSTASPHAAPSTSHQTFGPEKQPESVQDKVTERLVGFILLEKSKQKDSSKDDSVEDPRITNMLARIKTIVGDVRFGQIEELIARAPQGILFEAEMMFAGSTKIEKNIDDLLFSLEENILKEKFAVSMKELQQAERLGDKEKQQMLILKCQDLSLQISALNHKRKQTQ